MQAVFASGKRDSLHLDFDQPIVWSDELVSEFYLDDQPNLVVSGNAVGKRLTLKLKKPTQFRNITYLKEKSWSQTKLLMGVNGIAALTFCNVVPVDEIVSKP